MIARYKKYELHFKRTAKTSRAEYDRRIVWFLFLTRNGKTGIGECAPLPGLSRETTDEAESLLKQICRNPEYFIENPELTGNVSSVHFALETAVLDLQNGGRQILFPSLFTEGKAGIPINGLIWMANPEYMNRQIRAKIDAGFRCIKLKIGSLDFEEEFDIISNLRREFGSEEIIIRLDANGAFGKDEVLEKLHRLASLDIHSVEQPVAAGNWQEMSEICKESPIPVALDEELIGINSIHEKRELLETVKPRFLILKPSLHGGFSGCSEWIELAGQYSAGWWVTSYLESNIGLNAIAQWTYHKKAKGYQGLGTGGLFTNNIDSPLEIRSEELWMNSEKVFNFPVSFFEL